MNGTIHSWKHADEEMVERRTESLVGKNRFDIAWDKVRKQNAAGLNWTPPPCSTQTTKN
jgi:hypothetical protein